MSFQKMKVWLDMAKKNIFRFFLQNIQFFFKHKLVTYMGVKLASKAQFYVKDIFGQIFKFVRNMRENKDNESFLGFVEKGKQCHTNQ